MAYGPAICSKDSAAPVQTTAAAAGRQEVQVPLRHKGWPQQYRNPAASTRSRQVAKPQLAGETLGLMELVAPMLLDVTSREYPEPRIANAESDPRGDAHERLRSPGWHT